MTQRPLTCQVCDHPDIGDPWPKEGQGLGWFTREQLLGLRGGLNYGNELMLNDLAGILPWQQGPA